MDSGGLDAQVGLVYFGARYYSPQLGRFISPDPMTIHQLKADLNPYAYVSGSPVRFVDPFGLNQWGEVVQGGGESGGGGGADPWQSQSRSGSNAYSQQYGQAATQSSAYSQAGWYSSQAWGEGGGGSGTPSDPSGAGGGPHHPMPDSILERVPGGLTWPLNPKVANVLQKLFDDLATKNGDVPLSVKSVRILMIPALGETSKGGGDYQNWVCFRPELLELSLPGQLAEIAHEMTHVLQWYRLASTVEQRKENWDARARVDQRLGIPNMLLPVAWNPDGTTTPIGSLIGGNPTRLDVLDRRFTLEGVAHWVERGYVLPHNPTFSLL